MYAGPIVGVIGTIAFTLLFSVPQAMYTCELSTALPVNAGYTAWVQAAFGETCFYAPWEPHDCIKRILAVADKAASESDE